MRPPSRAEGRRYPSVDRREAIGDGRGRGEGEETSCPRAGPHGDSFCSAPRLRRVGPVGRGGAGGGAPPPGGAAPPGWSRLAAQEAKRTWVTPPSPTEAA